jgi:hypothetical protein
MKKILSSFLWLFYVAIILYVFFAVLHLDTLENFISAMIFEMIGFIALAYLILRNIFSRSIKVGYFVPLLIVTLIYTIVLDIINLFFVTSTGNVIFVLINLVVLFVYFLISIPMYLMGRR